MNGPDNWGILMTESSGFPTRERLPCTTCGHPSDGWPNADGSGELCQDHWEAECDEEWWNMVIMLDCALNKA